MKLQSCHKLSKLKVVAVLAYCMYIDSYVVAITTTAHRGLGPSYESTRKQLFECLVWICAPVLLYEVVRFQVPSSKFLDPFVTIGFHEQRGGVNQWIYKKRQVLKAFSQNEEREEKKYKIR